MPLAVATLCLVAGLPAADFPRFRPWVRQIHRVDGGAEAGQRILEAMAALDGYLEERLDDDGRDLSGVLG